MKFLRISFLLLCVLGAGTALASDMPPMGNDGPPPAMNNGGPGEGHGGHRRPGPPPEALAACKSLSAGAKTTMKTPRGDSLSGTCQLVFVPEMKSGEAGPPPPQQQGQQHSGGAASW